MGGALAAPGAEALSRTASKLPGYEVARLGQGNFNRLNLPITVDGTKGLVFLDTGASGSLLSADKFGFLLRGGDQKLPDGIPTKARINDAEAPVAMVHELQIGSIKVGSFPLRLGKAKYFQDNQMLYGRSGTYSYDGMMGEELLRHFRAIIDCTRLILYLNTDASKIAKLDNAMTAAGWTRVPMSDAGPHLVVPCTLRGHHFQLLVDTGAPFTHLDLGLLSGAQIETKDIGMRSALVGTRVPVSTNLVMSDSINIGDLPLTTST